MNTVELEKLKVGAWRILNNELLLDASVFIDENRIFDAIIMEIRGFVWAEKESVKHQEVTYPRDWWQALKARWFPKWLLAHHPVHYHKVVLDARALYPEFKAAMPNQTMRIAIQRSDDWDWMAKEGHE